MGELLAERLGLAFRDTDRLLAEREGSGRSAGELLGALGEKAFRDLEEAALDEALLDQGVVATGGGAVEREGSRARLAERAVCVWLRADPAILAARLERDAAVRPALLGEDAGAELVVLDRRRAPHFAELAELTFDSGRCDPCEIVREIEGELRKRGLV